MYPLCHVNTLIKVPNNNKTGHTLFCYNFPVISGEVNTQLADSLQYHWKVRRRRRGCGLTSEGREQRAVLLVITFVALTEVEKQEHIDQHPHKRGGQHHLAVDKPSHHLSTTSVKLWLGSARSVAEASGAWRRGAGRGGRLLGSDKEASSYGKDQNTVKNPSSSSKWSLSYHSSTDDDTAITSLPVQPTPN